MPQPSPRSDVQRTRPLAPGAPADRSTGSALRYARYVLLGLAALLVLVAIGSAVYLWLQHREQQAALALDEALLVYQAPIVEASPQPEDPDQPTFPDETARRERAKELFTEVRDRFGGSDPADVAGLYLARIAAAEGDTERARELWSDFVDEHPSHVLAGNARLNLLTMDREAGRHEDTIAELQAMLGDDEAPLPGDVILWELARTYEAAGQDEAAADAYQRLAEEYPASGFAGEAQARSGVGPVQAGLGT